MPVLATLLAIGALAIGVALGFAVARRGRVEVLVPLSTPVPDPTSRRAQPLAALVVEALNHGVIVLDREERAVLVNPAARSMGILDVDTLAFPELVSTTRKTLETGEQICT
ncbi:MAG: hypothetical protein J0H43_09510, partial [Actinobacteria bacterium]|nr:hypothetical protein [Actinomycetota bacterium]